MKNLIGSEAIHEYIMIISPHKMEKNPLVKKTLGNEHESALVKNLEKIRELN